ncbi:MAG: aminotransferase class III-fold pyridoxal phosphate-dependent enzyme, partial [Acidobacteria bacterium]|nr:aminotransferase class III-fold pyridoxal phosphate-dependent enzyme [Acidobacteriota bacterium]
DRYVLKIANSAESLEFLRLQNELIEFLAGRGLDLQFPRIIPSRSGEHISSIPDPAGQHHFTRLFTWIEGVCLGEIHPHTPRMLASLGRALGQMDAALAGFAHPAAHREFHWDLRAAAGARSCIPALPAARCALVEPWFERWQRIEWERLRSSVIHNDGNDYNVLVNAAGQVVTILDYGDVVYGATVCNLAVALAYVMLGKADPIAAAAQVVSAYHEIFPLNEAEVEALYLLAGMRLCMSVCYAAHQTKAAPGNSYLNISNAPAWALLERLANVPLEWPLQMFRFACGIPLRSPSRVTSDLQDLAERRKRNLGSALSLSYRRPVHMVAASRQYMYDGGGRRYLDCVNNVNHVGHCHPAVVRAAAEQMAILNTNTRYLHETVLEYSARLAATLPPELHVVYLVNSGSEANELALRMARAHTGRSEVIVIEGAYHGNTSSLVDLSPYKFDGPGGRGCPAWVHKVPLPDCYRGLYRGPHTGEAYAPHVAQAVAAGKIAAFFAESAPGCGGQIILPAGYLNQAFAAVRAAGGVCIADEVQTGLGRAGRHFWMFEAAGAIPDIVTLGKPIGNGHPLGAVITTTAIAQSFANGMEYFNTFGGNPVSCAAGLAVLDAIRDEGLQQNALETGDYLLNILRELQGRHAMVGDVRGAGLFLGVELVHDRESREPATREAAEIVERMKDRGVLLSADGPAHNVLKIKPPLVFSQANAAFLAEQLDAGLNQMSEAH